MTTLFDEATGSFDALIILDENAAIKASHLNIGSEDRRWLFCDSGSRLSSDVEGRVRDAISMRGTGIEASMTVLRNGSRTLRVSRLDGAETLFALVLEIDRNEAKMLRAVARYQLTRRQTEVLALLLDGSSASDVARALVISEYTAQGYVKCLLTKTASHNRAEMVAKVLDWKSGTRAVASTALGSARAS